MIIFDYIDYLGFISRRQHVYYGGTNVFNTHWCSTFESSNRQALSRLGIRHAGEDEVRAFVGSWERSPIDFGSHEQ